MKKRLLFVCLGNIVRSPLAENVFRFIAKQNSLEEKYEVSSGGTDAWHVGETPDPRMVRVAALHGLHYTGKARQVQPKDIQAYDLILAMDLSNLTNLLRMANGSTDKEKIHLLREFDILGTPDSPVPDPYYGGLEGFEEVYHIIERSCQGLLDALESGRI